VLDDAETLIRDGHSLLSIGARAVSLDQVQGQFMGLLRVQPSAWTRAAKWLAMSEYELGEDYVDRLDMTSLLQALISHGETIRCVQVDGGWVEIDSARDLGIVEGALREPGFTHDFR
jgi:L-glutamine-phosphate cytidylyltransferase